LSYNYINSKSILQKIKKKKIISDLDLNFLRLDAIIKFRNLINKKKLINSNVSVKWYLNSTTLKNKGSWKNDEKKGGGLLYNFGFHLFAILLDLFGDLKLLNAIKKKKFL
jgi:predicted dehydrogenase